MITRQSSSGLEPVDRRSLADAVLRSAVGCWFVVTAIGQWLFMYYVVALYGPSTASGHFEDWHKKPLFKGYIPGDTVGNLSFAAHVLFAAVFSFGGVLQLVPQIRAHAIAVHRWIGRAFLVAAAMLGASGLYMVWVRHARFHWAHSFSITLNALLILGLVAGTWRAARAGDIDRHRRWALRAFMVANAPGVFVRVAYGAWSVFARGAGTNEGMTGPTNFALAFGSYLVPLAVLELYLRARAGAGTVTRFAAAVVVVVFTAYLTVGTLAAAMSRRALVG